MSPTLEAQRVRRLTAADHSQAQASAAKRNDSVGYWLPLVVLAVAAGLGHVLGLWAAPILHNKMLPWILGRGLGLAAYLTLTALVSVGLWLHHPWRSPSRLFSPVAQLRTHTTLAAATAVLIAGHISALALDRYAGVGWSGAFVPGQSTYRTTAVAVGTIAVYSFVLVGATAALAGSVGRRAWLPVHRLASVVFALVWLHGVLAGSDTPVLRTMYIVTGLAVLGLAATRRLARPRTERATLESAP